MDKLSIYVGEDDNERLDIFLSRELDDMSRSYVQKLIKEGNVFVNEKKVKSSYLVAEGDRILVEIPEAKIVEILPEDIPLRIIYQDQDIVIVDKPLGMVVHPAPGNHTGTLVNALMYHIKELSTINGVIRPGIVHRLDKDTSGLIIVAKNNKSHLFLSESLKARQVTRAYKALVFGNVKENSATINKPIGRDPKDRKKMAISQINSREAISHYEVLKAYGNYTFLKVNLETGRTHQIRVHMASINHPIVGDMVYSKGKNEFGVKRQLLHAYKLGFIHPRTLEAMEFESSLPDDFDTIITLLNKKEG